VALNKAFLETGSSTIIRSLFETYLKMYENRYWTFARNLEHNLFGSQDNPYLDRITDEQLIMKKFIADDGHEYPIIDEYGDCVKAVQFLREIRGLRGRERKECFTVKLAIDPYVAKVTELPNCTRVTEESVVDELKSIYSTLSDIVHQADATFCGDNEFQLPRANQIIFISRIYAYATIVQACGFTPVYPDVV
jgi:hypothetical protein